MKITDIKDPVLREADGGTRICLLACLHCRGCEAASYVDRQRRRHALQAARGAHWAEEASHVAELVSHKSLSTRPVRYFATAMSPCSGSAAT